MSQLCQPDFVTATPFQSLPNLHHELTNAIAIAYSGIEQLEHITEATFNDLNQHLYIPLYSVNHLWNLLQHLSAVQDSKELRDLIQLSQDTITNLYLFIQHNKHLYQQYKILRNNQDLTSEQQKILDNALIQGKLNGVNLPKSKKNILESIEKRLNRLSTKFEQNLLDVHKNYNKYVNVENLNGIPQYLLNQYLITDKTSNTSQSIYRITLNNASYEPIMQYCHNRQLRQELYYAYITRASELGTIKYNNAPIINKILHLRHKQAQLLQYTNWTQLTLSTCMLKTSEQVLDFLNKLLQQCRPIAHKEWTRLSNFARKHYGITQLEAWDIAYISEQFLQHNYSYSTWDIKQYFPLNKVLTGLFDLLSQLYAISFNLNTTLPLWDKNVIIYNVTRHNIIIGVLYLDLFSRDNKQDGAWMNGLQDRFIDEPTHTYHLPIASIMCNFAPDTPDISQTLLGFTDVQTLFHEMGHAVHHLLTQINHYTIAGINGVEFDGIELPSQFMEYFVWDFKILHNISCHINFNKPLPKNLYKKLIKSKYCGGSIKLLRQIELSTIDIMLHHNNNHLLWQDVTKRIHQDISYQPYYIYNKELYGFAHIFAGGYASNYYSYLWAEMMAADIFEKFENQHPTLWAQQGNTLYKQIIAQGGLKSMLENFTNFTHRKPNITNLCKHYGLTPIVSFVATIC